MSGSVHVRAPCRLHFGMFSFGHAGKRQFGGVGAMVEPPALEVTIRSAERFNITGSLAQRAESFVQSISRHWRLSAPPPCKINISSPPDHTGLGIGTQLGLSLAAALRRFMLLPELTAEELAASVGRGARSAIGTYGFQRGGLLVDAGKLPGETLGNLMRHIVLPAAWRFVLVRSVVERGLAGASEADAFSRLPPVPESVAEKLWQVAQNDMLPAIEREDCASFGNAVYEFGRLAGNCFSTVQGGPFASPRIEQLVDTVRRYGVSGVGQSSWGPTIYAIVPSDADAYSLGTWLRDRPEAAATEIGIASPNNTGAQVSTL